MVDKCYYNGTYTNWLVLCTVDFVPISLSFDADYSSFLAHSYDRCVCHHLNTRICC